MAKKSKDVEATRAAKFMDRRSRVNLDETVECYGADMQLLRDECMERDNFRCVVKGCKTPLDWVQMNQIIPRGSNGVDRDDRIENVEALCGFMAHLRKDALPCWMGRNFGRSPR